MKDFREIKIPSIEQCKFSNHGKRIGCEYGPARFASQKYGTEAEKRNEAYMMVCQRVNKEFVMKTIVENAVVCWASEGGFDPFCCIVQESTDLVSPESCEIIGNIYENPELLKEGA